VNNVKSNGQYSVLNPWAEVDLPPLKGIAPRLDSLSGKRIGLFRNFKAAANQIFTALEPKLKDKYPDCQITWYYNPNMGTAELESERKAKFEEWLNNLDAVVLAVGD
jgi:hypothetical protein